MAKAKGKKKPVKPVKPGKHPGHGGQGGTVTPGTPASGFQFEDPQLSPDDYSNFSSLDRMADSGIRVNNPPLQPIPAVRKDPPVMSLQDVMSPDRIALYKDYIVFHSGGDSGGIREPSHQFLVADKMVEDFHASELPPAFFFHLGDVVYYFGQDRYYYDQFYDPYRNYPAPIFAIPGNHDAVVYPGEQANSLEAFRKHFCADRPMHVLESMGKARTTMVQPGVYFTLNAPFVKIIGLYSNTQEGSGWGTIAGGIVGQAQLQFLTDQLRQAGTERRNGFEGALIIAVHHPPFTGSEDHNPSPDMLDDIDQACKQAGVWPDAVLSGHAHLFERFTRYVNDMQVPFVVAGTAGYYNLSGFKKQPGGGPAPRPPLESQDRSGNRLVLEHYLDQNYGFLRLTAGKDFLSCEFVGVTDDATPGQTLDRFTIDLTTHQLTGFRKS